MKLVWIPSFFLLLLLLRNASCLSQGVVDVKTWTPTWSTDCVSSIVNSLIVPNILACQTFLDQCPNCCIAGFNPRRRECHLLKASPAEVMPLSPGSATNYCLHKCGECGPVKREIFCPILPSPINGSIAYPNGNTGGKQANFSCAQGYKLIGEAVLTCLDNSSWSATAPKCMFVYKSCTDVKVTNPGAVSGEYYLQPDGYDVIIAFCYFTESNAGYMFLHPSSVHTALNVDIGQLYNDSSRIMVLCQNAPKSILESVIQQIQQYKAAPIGTSLLKATSGYAYSGRVGAKTGLFAGMIPTANITTGKPNGFYSNNIDCSFRNADTNSASYWIQYYNSTEAATFNRITTIWYTSTVGATWFNSLQSHSGGISPSFLTLMQAGFGGGGFLIHFGPNNPCTAGAIGIRFVFADYYCTALNAPSNGIITYLNETSAYYPHQAIISCDPGYELMGNTVLTCLTNSSWDASAPTNCTRVKCPDLVLENGNVTYPNGPVYENQAIFSCAASSNLIGNGALTCLANATWNGSAPSCTTVISFVGNATIMADDATSEVGCPDGMVIIGWTCDDYSLCDGAYVKKNTSCVVVNGHHGHVSKPIVTCETYYVPVYYIASAQLTQPTVDCAAGTYLVGCSVWSPWGTNLLVPLKQGNRCTSTIPCAYRWGKAYAICKAYGD